jgi:hypothetical protein
VSLIAEPLAPGIASPRAVQGLFILYSGIPVDQIVFNSITTVTVKTNAAAASRNLAVLDCFLLISSVIDENE